MSEFNIEVQGGSSVRLPTAGKYCDRDIVVTASGGSTEEIENLIDESGVLESTDGTATEKVEQLIDKAEDENLWVNHMDNFSFWKYTGSKLPRLNIEKINAKTDFGSFFREASNLESVDFYIDAKNATSFYFTFAYDKKLTRIKGVNTSKATTLTGAFRNTGLITIEEPLNFSSATAVDGVFEDSVALKDILFVPETIKRSIKIPSPVLSNESKDSIINGLAYVETAQTLTVPKNAGFTAEHKATAQSKGWTVVER